MEFLRGVRSKVFTVDTQVEPEPTLLYGVALVPAQVGTAGILRCYDGRETAGELKLELQASYDFGAGLAFPIQFMHGLYIDLVSGLTSVTIMWLTNEAALALFHNELRVRKCCSENGIASVQDMLRMLGL